jgi:hypothetical protein
MDPMALLQVKVGEECGRVHHQIQEYGYHVEYLSQEPYVLLKYLGIYTIIYERK